MVLSQPLASLTSRDANPRRGEPLAVPMIQVEQHRARKLLQDGE